jgi:hypothetical protein
MNSYQRFTLVLIGVALAVSAGAAQSQSRLLAQTTALETRGSAPEGHALLAATRATLTPAPPAGRPRPTLTPAGGQAASLCLALESDPNSAAAPAATVTYQIIARNLGRGAANNLHWMMPLSPRVQSLRDIRFSRPDAWVSAILADAVEMRLAQLLPGEVATTTLRLYTSETAPVAAALNARVQATWSDKHGGAALSNRVSLVVGRANVSSPTVPLEISVVGAPVNLFVFSYAGFASSEQVSLWYHRANGADVGLGQVAADTQGRLAYNLPASALPSGEYQIVAYGHCSQVSAVGVLTVAP